MARKQLVPSGPKRGGKGKAPPFGGRKAPPFGAGKAAAPSAPVAPSRPRPRAAMGPPVQILKATPGPTAAGPAPGPMGPAMARGVGASPVKRAVARGMRGGQVAF